MGALPPQSVSRSILEVGLSELVPIGWFWTHHPTPIFVVILELQGSCGHNSVSRARLYLPACSAGPQVRSGQKSVWWGLQSSSELRGWAGGLSLGHGSEFQHQHSLHFSPWRKRVCPPWEVSSLELRLADGPWALFTRTESSWQWFV